MRQRKILSLVPLLLALIAVTSCSDTSSNPSNSSSDKPVSSTTTPNLPSSPSTVKPYNPEWKPGDNSLEDAAQPTIKNPAGEVTELGKMRASSLEAGLPQKGQANILVVPVQFALDDETSASENDLISEEQRTALNSAYFGSDSSSVKEFYQDSSFDKLHLDGVVSPVISLPKDFSTYVLASANQGQEKIVSEITDYVYDYLFEETETYYIHDFDADDDGKVDNLVIAYSWSYNSWIFNSDYDASLSAFFAEKTFFATSPQVDSITWTTAKIDDEHDEHQYIREVGRALGLDYYFDETGLALSETTTTYRAPLANTDVMDACRGDHNAFSKYQLGWIAPDIYTPANLAENKQITLTAGDAVILSYKDTGLFGEYLILDLALPADSDGLYTETGVRVYKVDSRIARKNDGYYYPFEGETDYTDADYTYAYSNSSTNPLSNYGIDQNYPLVTLLSEKASNRHMTDATITFTNDDLFKVGDSFGTESIIEGFYEDFRFDGDGINGPKLGIIFSIDQIENGEAKITLRRAA